ncbi:MAG: sigma-70 family RNA polymerase sigma factor [Gemmatimonadetes bacterium]|nr:sigma-70 family RNA polymerase sigma factor [Gemmatimonadota bacterium]MBI3568954.1 sigma-70 family RNA polymerase sigma factor [Gemmatimonadota bacterium]
MTDLAPPADDAFEQDTLRFLPDLLRFAKTLTRDHGDAEDLVQETYLRAFRGRSTFRAGSSTRQWLFTICRNVFLRQRERDRWQVPVEDDAELEALASVGLHVAAKRAGADDIFERVDFGPALERALGALAEPYRVVVAMVDVADQSYEDVAQALGVPVGTVRSRLFRGRRELQAALIAFARDAGLVPATLDPNSVAMPRRAEPR